jgi:hypothetical protein
MRISLLCLFALASPALAAERRYSVIDFDRVEVLGPYKVTLATGLTSSARASGSPAALDRLSIDVQGRTLRVRASASAWGGYPGSGSGPATIALTTRDLQAVTVNGSGALAVDKARGLKLSVSVIGSGQLSIAALDSDNLIVNLFGSGTATLKGKARSMRVELHGTTGLDAAGLTAADAQIIADSSGQTSLAVSRSASIVATGAGDVAIHGKPACTVKSSGSGEVNCGGR